LFLKRFSPQNAITPRNQANETVWKTNVDAIVARDEKASQVVRSVHGYLVDFQWIMRYRSDSTIPFFIICIVFQQIMKGKSAHYWQR